MNKIKKELKCPLCSCMMQLREIKDYVVTYKNRTIVTDHLTYECDECIEAFENTEIAEINLERIIDKFEEITSS